MSSDFLRIEMGKALHGDCLFVEWGGANGKHRMLIDGGPIGAYEALATRIAALPAAERIFELMVLSHVDTDHIEGMVRLFAEPAQQWPFQVKDVWFNGWRHMEEEDTLGGRQGEFFSALLQHRLPPGAWNHAFKGAVVVPPKGPLPRWPRRPDETHALVADTVEARQDARSMAQDLQSDGIKPGDVDAALAGAGRTEEVPAGQGCKQQSFEYGHDPHATVQGRTKLRQRLEHRVPRRARRGSCLFSRMPSRRVTASLKRLLEERGAKRLSVGRENLPPRKQEQPPDEQTREPDRQSAFSFSKRPPSSSIREEVIARIIDRAGGRPVTLYFNYLSEFNKKWKRRSCKRSHNIPRSIRTMGRPARDYHRYFPGRLSMPADMGSTTSSFIASAVSPASF